MTTAAGARARSRSPATRGCLTIAFAPAGAEWEFEPPDYGPLHPPGAGRDALPRAVGARARVLRAPRPARAGASARPVHDAGASSFLYPFLDERESTLDAGRSTTCARSVLMKAAGGRRAARADADRQRGGARRRRRRAAARASTTAASCSRSATAARRPTRWTSWRTSARAAARPAIDLTEDPAILTAIANDIGVDAIFSRQVIAYGAAGDALLALSTSGNSRNVIEALAEARRRGLRRSRWSATTAAGSAREGLADHVVVTRSEHIPRIQEAQASAYHVLRELVELGRTSRPSRRRDARAACQGTVQGVGFRPVRVPARRTSSGSPASSSTTPAACCSRSRAARSAVDGFLARLAPDAPPLAVVERVVDRGRAPRGGERLVRDPREPARRARPTRR